MPKIEEEKKIPTVYVPLLLIFILGDELCNNFIFNTFDERPYFQTLLLYPAMLIVQIICAPIQSSFSDFYSRKRTIALSLSFSLLALILAFLYEQKTIFSITTIIFIILAKGGFGNTLPLSWAGIGDAKTKNHRFSFGLSTAAIALGYLTLILLERFFGKNKTNLILILYFTLLVYLCIKYFLDIRDVKRKKEHRDELINGGLTIDKNDNEIIHSFKVIFGEIALIARELKLERTRKALATFLLWEISLYSIHMLDVDLQIKQFTNLTATMVYGYLVGVVILKFLNKIEDEKMIKIGYSICILSVVPFFLLFYFFEHPHLLMLPCYFFYNLGTVFLAPSLFSILSKERKAHEQGKIYGLLESTDTIAFLLATIVAMTYNISKLNPVFIVSFSFLIFVASWFPYGKFKQLKRTQG